MGDSMGDRIKVLRKDRGLTQKMLADATGLSFAAIKSYENNLRQPNSKAMAALEKFFDVSGMYLRGEVDDPRTASWEDSETNQAIKDTMAILFNEVLKQAQSLDDKGRKFLFDILVELRHVLNTPNQERDITLDLLQYTFTICTRYMDICSRSHQSNYDERSRLKKIRCTSAEEFEKKLEKIDGCSKPRIRLLPKQVSEQSASAGTGTYLGVDSFYTIYVEDNKETQRMMFAVPVSGNSMEPSFYDGDLLMVADEPVEQGDIGIFVLDGEGYVKQLGHNELISLNPEYEPIPLDESIRVSGRVIGVLDPTWIHDDTDF